MSRDVATKFGTLRRCRDGDVAVWLLWCPVCEEWERLNEDQMEGRVSVNHAATGCPSGYHETHEFAKQIVIENIVNVLAPYAPSTRRGDTMTTPTIHEVHTWQAICEGCGWHTREYATKPTVERFAKAHDLVCPNRTVIVR